MLLTSETLMVARRRLLRMHYESRVGHIGGNLSALDATMLLFHEFIKKNDTFILSKGHSAGALYIALWSIGNINDEEIKSFHRNGTRLSGHPPVGKIESVPFATGSLGHGLSLASGTALAKKLKGDNGHTYCLTSDGEWQEGSTWEALIFLCHHKLKNLTVFIDQNKLQGFGETSKIASMNSLQNHLKNFAIDTHIVPGHDINAIRSAIRKRESGDNSKPRIIILETVKGHGVSFMENKMEWHYLPMTDEQYDLAISEIEDMK